MQDQAFAAAVKSLGGEAVDASEDPVSSHFNDAFASLEAAGDVSPDATGSLAERVAFAQQEKESEFRQTFMVTAEEAAEVKALAGEAGADFDPNNLSADSLKRLEGLYTSINNKVGYAVPDLKTNPIPASSDSAADAYVEAVNSQLTEVTAKLHAARLKAFTQSFA